MLPDGVRVGSPASAVVRITDNDTAGVKLGKTELIVTEGRSVTYTVELDSEPTADVTVTITGHAGTDLTLTPNTAMLTFTSSTWDRTQTVTVAAGDDGDVLNDSARLTHRARGATEYASVAVVALSVTVTDDDARATGAPAITGTAEVGEEADGEHVRHRGRGWSEQRELLLPVGARGLRRPGDEHLRRDVSRLHGDRGRRGQRLQTEGDFHG